MVLYMSMSCVLLAAGAAAKIGSQGGRGGFTVTQVPIHHPYRPLPGPLAYAHALAKHGIPTPSFISAAKMTDDSIHLTTPLSPTQNDTRYYGKVSIGTPQRQFLLQFDTGSSDTWGYTQKLPEDDKRHHKVWTPRHSQTSKLVTNKWIVGYGDGSLALGDAWTDTVKIGSTRVSSVGVGGATYLPSANQFGRRIDGLVGLTNRKHTTFHKPTLMTALVHQKILTRNIFAMALKHQAPGSIDFGYIDSSKYSGRIQYTKLHNLTKDNYTGGRFPNPWLVKVASFRTGSVGHNLTINNCIVDSGTTLMIVAGKLPALFYAQMSSAQLVNGSYTFPCADRDVVPDLHLDFVRQEQTTARGRIFTVTISGSLLTYRSTPQNASLCYGGVQPSSGVTIFGDPIFKGKYVVFDHDKGRLGFAPQAV